MTSLLQFARRHEEDSEARWKKNLWSDETEIELLAIKLNAMLAVHYQKHTIPTVKRGDPGRNFSEINATEHR